MQYERNVFSRRLKMVRLAQVFITVGKLFHRDVAVIANEQSPALLRVRFTSNMLLFAERSVLVGLYGHTSSHKYTGASLCMAL